MVYDDDEGPPPHIDIRASEHPVDGGRPTGQPVDLEQMIVALGRRPGYVPERIYCYLKERGHDVPVPTIRRILATAGLVRGE